MTLIKKPHLTIGQGRRKRHLYMPELVYYTLKTITTEHKKSFTDVTYTTFTIRLTSKKPKEVILLYVIYIVLANYDNICSPPQLQARPLPGLVKLRIL